MMYKPPYMSLKDKKKYQAMVKYRALGSPICVGQDDNREKAIAMAITARHFDRVWVVNNETGKIEWERRKGG